MEMWIGDLLVDVSPPEKPKFKSPLILIHGLWSGSWCWQSWATHFSNLGWECWAVNLKGRFEEKRDQVLKQLKFQGCVEDLKKVIRSARFPPVLLAYCFGGLVAQKAAEEEEVSALILLSPLPPKEIETSVPRWLRLLRLKYGLLLVLGRPFRLEESDFRRIWLASLPESQHPDILRGTVPDSVNLIREFFYRRVEARPERIHCPVLIVGGGKDLVAPMMSLRDMARWMRGDLKEHLDHGHWMLGEGGGEVIVRDIHRWVVQKLGEKILLAEFSGQE